MTKLQPWRLSMGVRARARVCVPSKLTHSIALNQNNNKKNNKVNK